MSSLMTRLHVAIGCRLGDTRRGATAVEYGLLLALVATVIMGAVIAFGGANANLYTKLADITNLIHG